MTGPISRRSLMAGLVLAASGLPGARAQGTYPARPVRIIVPFGAGGVADITIRIVAEKLGERLGQRFVVENMPGAGGVTAARAAATSAPDGYTLTMLTNGTAISVPLFANLPFDPLSDFVPISTLGTFDFVFAVNAQSEFNTLPDLVRRAKEKPGSLNVATVAVGSSQHLSSVLFRGEAGVDLVHVPFRSTPDALVSLIRNDANLLIDSYAALKSGLEGRQIRAVATSGPRRSAALPEVPTVQESGIAGFDVTSWNALFAPKGTPPAIVDGLNGALKEILAAPDVKARLLDLGIEARAETPAELTGRLRADIGKWRAVIEKAGIPKQ
ncbi:MAG TPA: tripartite tricarboxylate transporter substrate-binding protein [Microvirga sp.]|nr:tripartite tricarboxylate transporter substrate-binding protein [Microvirga sp.]